MAAELYTSFYGFTERPFTLLPDPGSLFWSKQHTRAYTVLEYGFVTRAPITVITGEVGTGKTTLIQKLLTETGPDTSVGLISNAQGGRGDLLRWVLNALDQRTEPGADYVALFQQFQDFAIAEYAAGRNVALIIDEAQNLGPDLLEELRMLTNINSGKDSVLQLVLAGQPELRSLIERPELRQFAQRVSVTFHLDPMDLATTAAYIRHRLSNVGGSGDEITEPAVGVVHRMSMGIPRVVNKICDLALVYGAATQSNPVGPEIIEELIADGLVGNGPQMPVLLFGDSRDDPKDAANDV